MNDLISRTAFRNNIQTVLNDITCPIHIAAEIEQCLELEPVVDAAPVVHGRPIWINPLDPGAKICTWKCSSLCSICGDYVAKSWNYCPNCGAKMDGERRDNI